MGCRRLGDGCRVRPGLFEEKKKMKNVRTGVSRLALASLTLVTLAYADDESIYWNQVSLQAIKTAGGAGAPPPKSSRNLAIQSVAAYDAVNAITKTHQAYHYNGGASAGASKEAAVIEASYQTLKALYPTQDFTTQRNTRLAMIADGAAKTDGINLGLNVANDILAARANDHSGDNMDYVGSTDPGKWRPTSAAHGLLPLWGNVTPFGLTGGAQFREAAMPTLSSTEYANAVNEVKLLGANNSATRTADQTNIALFWADGGGTVTPPGHWNRIAQTVGTLRGQTLAENARMFALLNMATADAAISCWDMKYTYSLWRPVTAIQLADTDGNALTDKDATWQPLIATPPFPSYSSGHSTFSAAAGEILKSIVGTDLFSFTTSSDAAIPDRSFTSFSQAVSEAGMSRIYGGIHYNFDNVVGQACGRKVGSYIYDNYLRAVPEPGSFAVLGLGALALMRRRRA